MIDQLNKVKELVRALNENGFQGAVCAGGFLRDFMLDLPAKDVDLFIPARSDLDVADLGILLSSAIGVDVQLEFDPSYGADSEINRVFSAGHIEGLPPVQIIEVAEGVQPLEERAHRHDFGLCQIWLGADQRVGFTQAFVRDFMNRTCTLVHCESAAEWDRSMRRWDRWKDGPLGRAGFVLVAPPRPGEPAQGQSVFDELFR